MNELNMKYTHTQDKRFYMTAKGDYPIPIIIGDGTHSRIRTENVYRGNPGDPIVEETSFGWVIHGATIIRVMPVCLQEKLMITSSCTVLMFLG